MFLQNIALRNFRNYNQLDLEFTKNLNIFVGHNAQGKTNLIESIYLMASGVSPRVKKDEELINYEEEVFYIKAKIIKDLNVLTVGISYSRLEGKRGFINNKKQKRLSDLLGVLNVVYFSPESLYVIKGSPSERRSFIDFDLCQISAVYKDNLIQYKRALKHRNHLLKQIYKGKCSATDLDPWNEQIASFGAHIIIHRRKIVNALSQLAGSFHNNITGGLENLLLSYKTDVPGNLTSNNDIINFYIDKFKRIRRDEISRGYTLTGPHRDDIIFCLNHTDLRQYGSQGQQRTAVLACKLAELELLRKETGEYPILLLDDVMSELDNKRRVQLLKILEDKVQTFITTTNAGDFQKNLDDIQFFNVKAGSVNQAR